MRILNISAQKPDSTGSGVYLASLERAFAKLGHSNATICGVDISDNPGDSLPVSDSVYPVRFNTPDLPFPVCGMSDVMPYEATRYRDLTPGMTQAFMRAFQAAIEQADREFDPDLVVCHHLYLLTALVRRTLPHRKVVAICHSTDLRQLAQHGLMRDYIVDAVRDLDGIYALHEAQQHQIGDYFDIDSSAIDIIGVGYDSSLFRALADKPESTERPAGEAHAQRESTDQSVGEAHAQREPAGPLVAQEHPECGSADFPRNVKASGRGQTLLYVGKIALKKGVLSLLNAYEMLLDEGLDLTLQLVGGYSNPDEYDQIMEKACSLPRKPLFLGELKPQDLAPVYQNAGVFVLPSFFEGLPLVIAEALASGCKVVATDLPGIRPFYERFVPQAPLWFVTPPPLHDLDTPDPADLPSFERHLAEAIRHAVEAPSQPCDATGLDWDNVGARLLEFVACDRE